MALEGADDILKFVNELSDKIPVEDALSLAQGIYFFKTRVNE